MLKSIINLSLLKPIKISFSSCFATKAYSLTDNGSGNSGSFQCCGKGMSCPVMSDLISTVNF